MASANSLPDFDSIIQRGAVTDPRPVLQRKRIDDKEISLNAAVEAARHERKSTYPNNKCNGQERSKLTSNRVANVHEDSVFSSDSSVGPTRRHHTPSTLPRTKFTATTPLEQKRAIVGLKQKLDFNGRSKETGTNTHDRQHSHTLNNEGYGNAFDSMLGFADHVSVSSITDSIGPAGSNVGSELSENVDVNKIITRLTQVREYLHQATTMYVSLSTSDTAEPSKGTQLEKLATLIQQLRIQEQGYIDLLQRTLVVDSTSEMTDITPSGSHLSLDDRKEENSEPQTEQLESLKQQQDLLKKIIDQQKQLAELKKRQSTLLAMQAQAERLVNEAEAQAMPKARGTAGYSRQNNQAREGSGEKSNSSDVNYKTKPGSGSDVPETKKESAMPRGEGISKKQKLEHDLASLVNKKEEMEKLISAFKTLKDSQAAEEGMLSVLGKQNSVARPHTTVNGTANRFPDQLSAYLSESGPEIDDSREKLRKLAEVRDRLDELRHIVSEYEQTSGPDTMQATSRDNRVLALNRQPPSTSFRDNCSPSGGARPKDPNRGMRIRNMTRSNEESNVFPNYADNRRQTQGVQGAHSSVDVNWNSPVRNEQRNKTRGNSSIVSKNLDLSAASKTQDPDLLSKIGQLQEARDRLVSFQAASTTAAGKAHDNIFDLGKVNMKPQSTMASQRTVDVDVASVSSVSNSVTELDWQDDPELVEKIKKLKIAKEKLKKLQDLVSVIQQDTMPSLLVNDLIELSLNTDGIDSSKADSNDEETDAKKDSDDASEMRSDMSEHQSQTSLAVEEGEDDADEEEGDNVSDSAILNNQPSKGAEMYEAETVYQEKRQRQREELNKLLKERQKLIEVQQQLSEITRKAMKTPDEAETTPRGSPRTNDTKQHRESAPTEKPASHGRPRAYPSSLQQPKEGYRGTGARPKLMKRSSNMSVEPQVGSRGGSELSYSPRHSRSVDTLPAAPLPNNPLVVSELRRQRDMFEQKKKQRFAEKHQMKQISDNASEGGTFSIRSDIDEGVGVSMMSADVTTATWGGSTEQSSTEEDSAVGEDEEREMDGAYGDDMAQAEEEEEEEGQSEGDAAMGSFFRRKSRPRKATRRSKVMTTWSDSDRPAGKKRKLNNKKNDMNRTSGTVSWAMNVSPSEQRRRPQQQNLTPAHRLIRDYGQSQETSGYGIWEQQCQQLHQQLASNTSLTGSLLRNQQTLLTMLQSQITPSSRTEVPSMDTSSDLAFLPTQNSSTNQQLAERFNRLVQSISTCQRQLTSQQQELKFLQQQMQSQNSQGEYNETYARPAPLSRVTEASSSQGAVHFGYVTSPGGTTHACEQPKCKTPTRTIGIQYREKTPYPVSKGQRSSTQEVNTQTETSLFGEQFHVQHHDYSLFGEQHPENEQVQDKSKETNFSPFRFYDTSDQSGAAHGDDSLFQNSKDSGKGSIEMQSGAEAASYNPLAYADGNIGLPTSSNADRNTAEVVTTTSGTPSKSLAMATLAGRSKSIWPSFLAQSTEQTGNISDGSSMYASSFPGRIGSTERLNQAGKEERDAKADERVDKVSDTTSTFSLFEALRDSIYSEVATLISMNEARPHYLIELFRELQLLTSDYLRQRALYALQDLVTRYLTDENLVSDDNTQNKLNYKPWTGSVSEHTPSESVVTSDDEEQKALEAMSNQIRNSDIYDYAEAAETGSTLSTPTSSADHPFARDQLGDTVINLDEALQKMKMYEENMQQTQRALGNMRLDGGSTNFATSAREKLKQAIDAMSNSSAGDFASETSSDVPQASVDTQKLDKQIKAVVMELVPFFNERTETAVTAEFLEEMKDLILTLARQREPHSEQEEFGRFFHKQLESILHDSLIKFTGKKLNECGEDIITDVSEILFNELAFFKLMQDLDRTPRRNPASAWAESNRLSYGINGLNNSGIAGSSGMPANGQDIIIQDYETSETSSMAPDVELVHNLEDGSERTEGSEEIRANRVNNGDQPDSVRSDSEDEAESSRQYVNLELSVSESRPVNSTGSGEEDLEEDQPTFPSGRANTSRCSASGHIGSEHIDNDADESQTESQGENEDTRPESEEAAEDQDPAQVDGEQGIDFANEEDEREENVRDMEDFARQGSEEETAQVDGEMEGAVGGDVSPNINSNNNNELDVDDSEVTIDDLPIKLTGLTEADLQARIASEQEQNDSAAALLSNFDGVDELAPSGMREPGSTPNGYPEE